MPIKTLKGRPMQMQMRSGLPIIGTLRKGESQEAAAERAKAQGKKFFTPQDLDYFRLSVNVTADTIYSEQQVLDGFAALYGDKPKSVNGLVFLSDDEDTVFRTDLAKWGRRQDGTPIRQRSCDGETITYRATPQGIDRTPTPCTCDWSNKDPNASKSNCQPSGELFFWLPQFTHVTGIFGMFKLTTHGSADIVNILSTLNMVRQTTGGLRGFSFTLYREPRNITSPDGLTVSKSLVFLGLEQASTQRFTQLAVANTMNLLAGGSEASNTTAALPAGVPALPETVASDEVIITSMATRQTSRGRVFWLIDEDSQQYKTLNATLFDGVVPLSGVADDEWFEVELMARIENGQIVEVWNND